MVNVCNDLSCSPCVLTGACALFFCGLVFLLYQEPGADFVILTDAQEHKSGTKDRAKWNAASFATKYNLKLVGVNYVVVRGDE